MLQETLRRGRLLTLGLLLTGASVTFGDTPQGRAGFATLDDEPAVTQTNPVAQTNYPCTVPNFGTVQPQFQQGMVPPGGVGPVAPHGGQPGSEQGYVTFNATRGGRCATRGGCNNGGFWGDQFYRHRCRNQIQSQRLGNGLGCTFAFAAPLTWWDWGARKDIIAVNPAYSDPRDSELYSAQGYGVPIAVPLAPVVRDTYNYGWGMPSSRLTPVATHAVP